MFDVSGKTVANPTLPLPWFRRSHFVDGIKTAILTLSVITQAPPAMAIQWRVELRTGSRGLRRVDNHCTGFFTILAYAALLRRAHPTSVRSLVERLQQGAQLEGIKESAASVPPERHSLAHRSVRNFMFHLRLNLEASRPSPSHAVRVAMASTSFAVVLEHSPRNRLRCLLAAVNPLMCSRMLPM